MPLVPVPVLSDGVVSLRAHREEDVQAVVEQCNDPLSVRWTTVPVPYGVADAQRFVREAMPGGWASDQEWAFAVEVDGRFGGTVSLRNLAGGRAEIAYGAHPAIRGTGAMERALRLLLDWGFSPEGRGLEAVIWYAYPGNWGSRRLAWRLGFDVVTGVLHRWVDHRGTPYDVWAGTLTRDDPREPRTPWLEAPVLDLGEVGLRPLAERDEARIVEAARDETVSFWIGSIPVPFEPEHARSWREDRTEAAASAAAVTWAIVDADDALLGVVNVFNLGVRPGEGEVGYWLHPAGRGRGIAVLAARAAARHALVAIEDGGLGLSRVRLASAVDNEASRRVAQAVGFRYVGLERQGTICRDGRHDTALYDLLPADLAQRDA
ncbi:MAG: GNAT family N-acetyltransferase [Nocardioidaceae bacterium]|nr:GNAT family N-acetyltransferase [Nocardioidaceae bacterium]